MENQINKAKKYIDRIKKLLGDALKCNVRNLFGYIYLLSMPTIGLVLIIISNETIPMIIFLISLSAYFILSTATIPGLKPKKETLNITFVEV